MSGTIKNSKPRLWFGLHMVEGVAEYKFSDKEPQRILVLENAIKEMDASFQGCPVFVQHRDEVDVDQFLNQEPDGIVVRSFYNKADGKHWTEFMTFTEEAEDRIRQGWQLSNAYHPKDPGPGGEWHGVSYDQEVRSGEYEHLAIVPNPRYKESVVLTPEDFKAYNSEKEQTLLRIANSDDSKGDKPMFAWNKKSKVEDKVVNDMESMTVTLPKSKIEKTVTQLVNEMDDYQLKMKEPQMANMDHLIEHDGKKMNLQQFCAEFDGLKNKLSDFETKAANEGGENLDGSNESGEGLENEEELGTEGLDNEEDDEAKKKKEKEAADKKTNAASKGKNLEALKNAPNRADAERANRSTKELPVVMTNSERVALGKKRYGSKPA